MLFNNIQIYSRVDGELVSNFLMREFQNTQGWVILHEKVPWALEMTRAALNARYPTWLIQILVTNCTRTRAQNESLARRLGWADEGGTVSRESFHLVEFGGIAADFVAYSTARKIRIPAKEVADIAALYFDYVKWYSDDHVHGDFRKLVQP
jgi:hypothetical protein